MSSVDWGETKAILLEVEQLFSRADDLRDVEEIKKMQTDLQGHYNAALLGAKELIKEMTVKVAEKEAEIVAPSEATHLTTFEKYEKDKENANQQIEALRQKIDAKRENIMKMAANVVSIQEKKEEFEANASRSDTTTSHALALHTKITNITWDYSVPAGRLGGCIGNSSTMEIKKFNIDTRSMTSFELANTLWDMVGEGIV